MDNYNKNTQCEKAEKSLLHLIYINTTVVIISIIFLHILSHAIKLVFLRIPLFRSITAARVERILFALHVFFIL